MKHLKNIIEEIVLQYVNKHIAKSDICRCEDCRADIIAIMLNNLQPHYVVTETGALFAQLEQIDAQHSANVAVAMAEAVEIVKTKPRHTENHSSQEVSYGKPSDDNIYR